MSAGELCTGATTAQPCLLDPFATDCDDEFAQTTAEISAQLRGMASIRFVPPSSKGFAKPTRLLPIVALPTNGLPCIAHFAPLTATRAGKPVRGLLPNIRVLKTPLGWIAGRITPLPARTVRIFAAEPIISPARFARVRFCSDSCVLTPWDLDCGTDYADARMERKGHCFEPPTLGMPFARGFYCGFAHVEATRPIRLARA